MRKRVHGSHHTGETPKVTATRNLSVETGGPRAQGFHGGQAGPSMADLFPIGIGVGFMTPKSADRGSWAPGSSDTDRKPRWLHTHTSPGQPFPAHSLEHGDEQVEQQDVGKEQIEAEQGDRQPLGESGCLPCPVTLGTLGLVGVCAIGAALVHAEVHTCEEWAGQPENRKSVSRNWLPGTLAVGALRVPIGSDIPRVRD